MMIRAVCTCLSVLIGLPLMSVQPNQDLTRALDQMSASVMTGDLTRVGEFQNAVEINDRDVKRFNVRLPIENSDSEIQRLRDHNVVIQAEDARPSVGGYFITFLPYLLLFGFWIFIFKPMQAGGAKAFSFGKSKAKLLTGDTPKVTFADVAGADEAKLELQEIIEFLKDLRGIGATGIDVHTGAALLE